MDSTDIAIRPVAAADLDPMWTALQAVAAAGETLPFGEAYTRDIFQSQWSDPRAVSVAIGRGGELLGMYRVTPNYADRGSHVANATYVVKPAAQGRGVGRALVQHSIEQARREGFLAMQFNYVVSTNLPAVALYRKLGFTIVGTLPRAFRHQVLGLVDAYVMHRFL